jgi:hypothetical protein
MKVLVEITLLTQAVEGTQDFNNTAKITDCLWGWDHRLIRLPPPAQVTEAVALEVKDQQVSKLVKVVLHPECHRISLYATIGGHLGQHHPGEELLVMVQIGPHPRHQVPVPVQSSHL